MKSKLYNFIELTRAYSVLMSVAPWFLTICWASIYQPRMIDVFLSLIGIICVHLGTNLLDDYMDVNRELDEGRTFDTIDFGAVSHKAALILNKTFSMGAVVRIIAVLYAIAVLIGIYYTNIYGLKIPALMLAAGVLCLLYPHAQKLYSGELIVALLFGPLLMSGTFLVLTGMWSTRILIFSVSVGILTAVLLHVHALMDWEYDCKRGKNTLCRLLKTKENAITALKVLISIAYLNVVVFVLSGWLNPYTLYVFLTLPIATKLIKSMREYIRIKDVKFAPRWWLGPMEDWKNIISSGRAFFMYRFYLARNLCFLFCVIAGIACYLG